MARSVTGRVTSLWQGLDEVYALLFESAFDLAEGEPEWAADCLAAKSDRPYVPLAELARQVTHYGNEITHINLATTFTVLFAPWRERQEKWNNELAVAFLGDTWFWAAILCAAGIEETHSLWEFRCGLSEASSNGWRDNGRLNLRLIREAPGRAHITPRAELMAHPILRMARLLNPEGSVEQKVVLRFFNARCVVEGFESEEDSFRNDLIIAQWVRDARRWAEETLRAEPQVCAAMFDTYGRGALEDVRAFYRKELGERPDRFDDLDAVAALMTWARRKRGYEFSRYRAEIWEFVVETANAALWLGWLFPRKSNAVTRKGTIYASSSS
ncbi:MAG: hypothetical protein WA183_13105 [Chthoniobacterales bacterium]